MKRTSEDQTKRNEGGATTRHQRSWRLSLHADGEPGYLYLHTHAVKTVKSETITQFLKDHVKDDATIVNDGFDVYRALAAERTTLTMKFDPLNNPDHMKRLHNAISNAKAFLLGTYHGINRRAAPP